MTEQEATTAAKLLKESGLFDAAEKMGIAAETARKQHFCDMAKRCADDMDFALAYEADRAEGF